MAEFDLTPGAMPEGYDIHPQTFRLERRRYRPRLFDRAATRTPRYRTTADREARRLHLTLVPMVLATALVFFVVVGFMGMGTMALAAAGAALVAIWVWNRPWAGVVLLVALAPLHQFVMMLVLRISGQGLVLRGAQAWKELVLAVLLLKCVQLAFRRRAPLRVQPLDVLIGAYLALTALYLVYPSSVEDATFVTRLYGARTDAMFLLPYFLVRGLGLTRDQIKRLLGMTVAISVVIAVVALLQTLAPGAMNNLFDVLGYSRFAELQRGISDGAFAVRTREVAGVLLPRASSLLLGDLALAFYQLMMAPLALALLLVLPGLHNKVRGNIYLLAMLMALALTVTRSAILAALVACLVLLLWRRDVAMSLWVALQAALLLVVVAVGLNLDVARLEQLFSLEESSSRGHITALEGGIALVQDNPLGHGLGTSGTIAQRFAPVGGYTPESWYIQIANEMGLPQALLFVAITVVFGFMAFRRYGQVRDPLLRALCLGMGGGIIGLAITAISLHAWEALLPSMLFWFFAGAVAAAPDLEREHRAQRAQAEQARLQQLATVEG